MNLWLGLATIAVVGLGDVPPTSANDQKKLETNRIGCENPQDMVDFFRLAQQAGQNQALQAYALSTLLRKIDDGRCHQFTMGTPVIIARKIEVQGYHLECLRDEFQSRCFFGLSAE